MESWKRLNGETVERVIVKSQCEVVSGLTPDTTCRERLNPRHTFGRSGQDPVLRLRVLKFFFLISFFSKLHQIDNDDAYDHVHDGLQTRRERMTKENDLAWLDWDDDDDDAPPDGSSSCPRVKSALPRDA